jgi:hydrogenase expression/formation protein HypD
VVSAHKTVPPALEALADGEINIDGFLLPGHVSVIIGLDAYRPFFEPIGCRAWWPDFEPTDLLQSIAMLVDQVESGRPAWRTPTPGPSPSPATPRPWRS